MKVLVLSLVVWTYCSGVSHTNGRPGTGSTEPDLRSERSDHDAHKTRPEHEITIKGCLLGQNGKFILITSKQSSVLQLVATPNLGVHAGHKVKITGTIEEATSPPAVTASPANEKATASTPAEAPSSGLLRVRKIKTISATCVLKSDKKKSWIRVLNL